MNSQQGVETIIVKQPSFDYISAPIPALKAMKSGLLKDVMEHNPASEYVIDYQYPLQDAINYILETDEEGNLNAGISWEMIFGDYSRIYDDVYLASYMDITTFSDCIAARLFSQPDRNSITKLSKDRLAFLYYNCLLIPSFIPESKRTNAYLYQWAKKVKEIDLSSIHTEYYSYYVQEEFGTLTLTIVKLGTDTSVLYTWSSDRILSHRIVIQQTPGEGGQIFSRLSLQA